MRANRMADVGDGRCNLWIEIGAVFESRHFVGWTGGWWFRVVVFVTVKGTEISPFDE